MWCNLKIKSSYLFECAQFLTQTKRSTFILKRTRPIRLNKLGAPFPKKLKRPQFYYELVEDTNCKKKPLLDLVLLKDVPGVGMAGEKIQENCYIAYRDFLLPKLAVYASSPEAKNILRPKDEIKYSSIYSKLVNNYLMKHPVPIFLNKEAKWILEAWHVKLALRRIGIIAKNECIVLPEKKIAGPDSHVENKDFIVKIIMNNSEIFPVRCRIYSWDNDKPDSSILMGDMLNFPSEPLFPEEKHEIDSILKKEKEIKHSNQIRENYIKNKYHKN